MTDILIRNVPNDIVAAIEASAKRAGLSRAEYLRRTLERECHGAATEVTMESLARFRETFADLADADVMRSAWS